MRARGARILDVLGLGGDELSLSLVDDAEIRGLNAAYRGRDRATDVLAFALTEDVAPEAPVAIAFAGRAASRSSRNRRGRVLGDVVISIDTAAVQARADGCRIAERLDALLVHGVLHLVGYDHELSPAEERRMQRKEREVRATLPRSAVATSPRLGPRARKSPGVGGALGGPRRRRRRSRRAGADT